ncbi:type I-E CRISPR-associated protein Cas6/Cse3/CasE [Photobacterium leiognathi]|uniref:type I-E CRISPR-associated protein Cas6/Cse3/CasE n=1 Tax=Photobacterium leiognathi TaxID=553611 RepID=UPI001EE0519E|nr:type I-E CRISPR-associated protein Cas6/Cse3/CasE [Photobacterium leiognathi]MCG3884486.1 type I-E CRISPR-associated protein Cas6/Cse3/CasE [Photobacterium leiognathi]
MQLYASVLKLNRDDCFALKVTDTYSIHRVVYSLFEDVRTEEEKCSSISSGIQWVDKGGDKTTRQILMLSDRKPTPNIDNKYGQVETKLLSATYLDHRFYRFNIEINPACRHGNDGKVRPIKGRKEIAKWFKRRAFEDWGFDVDESNLIIEPNKLFEFRSKSKNKITIQKTKISGCLTVTDEALFKSAVRKGLGRGRAYGCGLLLVVPIV